MKLPNKAYNVTYYPKTGDVEYDVSKRSITYKTIRLPMWLTEAIIYHINKSYELGRVKTCSEIKNVLGLI